MEEENKDLNKDVPAEEPESTPEEGKGVGEDIKEPEEPSKEDAENKADNLLDGTKKDKDIVVKKDKYDDINEKAKLWDTNAPFLEQVLQNQDKIKDILDKKDEGDLETRLAKLENEKKEQQRGQLKSAVTEAIQNYPDFDKEWAEIQDGVMSKIQRGVNPSEAIKREIYGLHPEYANQDKERLAQLGLNNEGMQSGGGQPPSGEQMDVARKLSPMELQIAQAGVRAGKLKSVDDYAKLLKKHSSWLDTNFADADKL